MLQRFECTLPIHARGFSCIAVTDFVRSDGPCFLLALRDPASEWQRRGDIFAGVFRNGEVSDFIGEPWDVFGGIHWHLIGLPRGESASCTAIKKKNVSDGFNKMQTELDCSRISHDYSVMLPLKSCQDFVQHCAAFSSHSTQTPEFRNKPPTRSNLFA